MNTIKKILRKALIIIATLLFIGLLFFYAFISFADSKHTGLANQFLKDTDIKNLTDKGEWSKDKYSRVFKSSWIKNISVGNKPYLMIVSNGKFEPSWIALVEIANKDTKELGLSIYFSTNCNPGSTVKTSKKFSNGDNIYLNCLNSGKWIAAYLNNKDDKNYSSSYSYSARFDGFNADIFIPEYEYNLLKQRNTLSTATKKSFVKGKNVDFIGNTISSRSNDALTCSGLFSILTSIPEPKEFNSSTTKVAIMMGKVYAHLQADNEDRESLTNGEISQARSERSLRLGELYDNNSEKLVDIMIQCNAMREDISTYLLKSFEEYEGDDISHSDLHKIYINTPNSKKLSDIQIKDYDEYRLLIDKAMTEWDDLGRITSKDVKNILFDSIKSNRKNN